MRSAAFENWSAKARAVKIEDEIARRGIKLRGTIERCGPCPKCGGEDRFSINTKKGVWNCRQCGVGGDVIELVEHLDGVDFIGACKTLAGEPPPKPNGKDRTGTKPKKIVVAEYPYRDKVALWPLWSSVSSIRIRMEVSSLKTASGKRHFSQKRPDPDHPGEWIWNVDGVAVLPYRLPELVEAIATGHPVLIVEGERKADLLWSWNIAATCNAGGARKWKPEHAEFLRGADVVLVPDNDNVGWEHVNEVGASLVGIAKRIRVLSAASCQGEG